MTELLYLEQMHTLTGSATVTGLRDADGQMTVVLDQTLFYPQGGGQPFDTGAIEGAGGRFVVEQTRFADGEALHIGHFERGSFQVGDAVTLEVDAPRRALNSRLHSAGHVVDMAVQRLGMQLVPGKGYHFPDGPYVEYSGALEGDKEEFRQRLETTCNALTSSDTPTSVIFASRDELASLCHFVPDYVPADKPSRVVVYGTFAVPCGGTHVANLTDIGPVRIRKIKAGAAGVRISYGIGEEN